MRRVKTPQAVLDEMVRHAAEQAPLECCGLLIGTAAEVRTSVRARNAEASGSRYLIDPVDHFAALKRARAELQQVIGGYHSHPHSSPTPSPTDLAEACGDFLYVIVGLDPVPQVRAYELVGGNFSEVALVPVS